jgi:hypothetical protein
LSKLASGSTCNARCIRGTEHGDAVTAALSDPHAGAVTPGSTRAGSACLRMPNRRLVLPSLFFVLAVPAAGDYVGQMSTQGNRAKEV